MSIKHVPNIVFDKTLLSPIRGALTLNNYFLLPSSRSVAFPLQVKSQRVPRYNMIIRADAKVSKLLESDK